MIYAQRLQLRQIVKVLLFTAAPVDGDIAIWITRQRRQQNRADIGEARATGNQDQRTVFVFTQSGLAMRNIDHDFTLFQDAVHHGHRVQVKLRRTNMQLNKFLLCWR